jgi:hypothetical protein
MPTVFLNLTSEISIEISMGYTASIAYALQHSISVKD